MVKGWSELVKNSIGAEGKVDNSFEFMGADGLCGSVDVFKVV